ncbi:MAG: hypothetical protein ABFD79_10275, partial [Phycisphaerales bacterium]
RKAQKGDPCAAYPDIAAAHPILYWLPHLLRLIQFSLSITGKKKKNASAANYEISEKSLFFHQAIRRKEIYRRYRKGNKESNDQRES